MTERSGRRWVDSEAAGEVPDPEAEKRLKRKRRQEADDRKRADDKEAAEGNPPDASMDRPKKSRRSGETPEPTPETSEKVPESEIRKIAAEAAFRRRVELAELRESIGEEAYAELRQRHGPDMRWYLEEGPLLLRAVVAETEPEDGPAKRVAVRYAVARETEPLPPVETVAKIAAAFPEPAPGEPGPSSAEAADRAEALAENVPAEESVDLVIDTADRGPVLVSIDRGTIEVHETASEDSPVVEQRTVGTEPEPEPDTEPKRPDATESLAGSLRAAERIASEASAEPLPIRREPESPFARTLETIERAWATERLPRIAGGSPELDQAGGAATDRLDAEAADSETAVPEVPTEPPEEREKKKPVLETPLPPKPETPAEPVFPASESQRRESRRPRGRTPRIPVPEFRGGSGSGPEGIPPLPDADTRRRAKRMLRKLAARFGLRLTPSLEGYLMQIVFRVRFVDGRLRRGIGVNIDILTRIMEALREHYPLYTPKRLR